MAEHLKSTGGESCSSACGKGRRDKKSNFWERRKLACRFRRRGEGRGGLEKAEGLREELREVLRDLSSGVSSIKNIAWAGAEEELPSPPGEAVLRNEGLEHTHQLSPKATAKGPGSLPSRFSLHGSTAPSFLEPVPLSSRARTAAPRRRRAQLRPVTSHALNGSSRVRGDGQNIRAEQSLWPSWKQSEEGHTPPTFQHREIGDDDCGRGGKRSSLSPFLATFSKPTPRDRKTRLDNDLPVSQQVQPRDGGATTPACHPLAPKSVSSFPSLPSIGGLRLRNNTTNKVALRKQKRKKGRSGSSKVGARNRDSHGQRKQGQCPSIDGEFNPPRRPRWFMQTIRRSPLSPASGENVLPPSDSPDSGQMKDQLEDEERISFRGMMGSRRSPTSGSGYAGAWEAWDGWRIGGRSAEMSPQKLRQGGDYLDAAQMRFKELVVANESDSAATLECRSGLLQKGGRKVEQEETVDRLSKENQKKCPWVLAQDLGLCMQSQNKVVERQGEKHGKLRIS